MIEYVQFVNNVPYYLSNLGFEVTLRTDANQRAMEESIRAFGNKLQSGGVGLFYYAGQGCRHYEPVAVYRRDD
jgi:uncharacterized caspase-like protein